MLKTVLNAKIHRATVTRADLDYMGSITIDKDLMDAVGIVEFEKVHIANIENGARFETYVIEGGRGSGVIGINGAAAHLARPGDLVIIMSYVQLNETELEGHRPRVVVVDQKNAVV